MQVNMRPCHNCGYINEEEAFVCESCGTELSDSQDNTASFEAIASAPETMSTASGLVREIHISEPVLFVTKGPNEGELFELGKTAMTLGRDPDSNVFLDDITVSRKHAQIYLKDGHYVLEDTGSLNGTYLNQERVETAALQRGDEIQIGKYRMTFLAGAERRKGG